MVENRPKSRIQHGERSDRSILMGQKSVEKAQIEKFKGDILGDFQTMCLLPIDQADSIWVFFV